MKIYKEIHADLEDIKHYANDIIQYARCHSGTMSTPNAYPLPYHKDSDLDETHGRLLETVWWIYPHVHLLLSVTNHKLRNLCVKTQINF